VGDELETLARERAFKFVANSLCLDFVNTLRLRDGQMLDLLQDIEDLFAWCVAAQIIPPARAGTMLQELRARREVQSILEQALALRTALVDMAQRLARGTSVARQTVGMVNALLGQWQGQVELVRGKRRYEKRLQLALTRPIHLLVPIAESAADLLSSADLRLVKKCQSSDCLIYFYDTTKNHSRSWCSMELCGNRAKAAAHYERQQRKRS
jgi:predicted RNA-binding Zn ribbon-like protein